MCESCGCGESGNKISIRIPGKNMPGKAGGHDHDHHDGMDHSHDHHHDHDHDHHDGMDHSHDHHHRHDHHDHHDHHNDEAGSRLIRVETNILEANKLLAERNRGFFEARALFVINLMSSPGSGKTTLLEKTIADTGDIFTYGVIEGDQQTMNDAERIVAAGAGAIQVNTGNGCHLDAEMINRAVKELNPGSKSVLVIENVGNLVCPSLFDLGENKRVVIISVTEGDDKPSKYPTIFETADLCLINKTDLLPYVDFDTDRLKESGLRVNQNLEFLELSAKTGEGMESWYDWIRTNTGFNGQ